MSIILFTDATCDLPLSYLQENNIDFLGLSVLIKGKESIDDLGQSFSYSDFYELLRQGENSSTSQINVFKFKEKFQPYIENGDSILYIGFSSGLSGTYNSALVAKEELLEEYPNADITIIDSLCASLGQGLLVYYANEMLKSGKTKEEIITWIEDNKLNICHFFTVDDLDHLKRGGRISGTAAVVGSLLHIKPLLYVNNEGKLIPYEKVRGRKKAIKALHDELSNHIVNEENQTIFISHGDCQEDALYLEKLIRENHNVKDVVISMIGPTIASHSGPGTLALFFIGDTRIPDKNNL